MTSSLRGLSTGQRCPGCDALIQAAAVNVSEGVAQCSACGLESRLSKLRDESWPVTEICQTPSRGCSIEVNGEQVVIKASLRSIPKFLAMCIFVIFWNSVVLSLSFLIVTSIITSLYSQFVGTLPTWLPEIIRQNPMPGFFGIVFLIFLIPFILIGIYQTYWVVAYLIGSLIVVIDQSESCIYTGIGGKGGSQGFATFEVKCVKIVTKYTGKSSVDLVKISTRNGEILFGSELTKNRKQWVCDIVATVLLAPQLAEKTLKMELPKWLTLHSD